MATIKVLVVGGGGAGGYGDTAGGGGAGEFYYNSAYPVTNGSYTVTIGNGGQTNTNIAAPGGSGGDTVFGALTCKGGGGGGGENTVGANGGSGGGGGLNNRTGGTTTKVIGNGNAGGTGTYSGTYPAGGGGGAGAVGANDGNGGAGLSSTIQDGSTKWYAGGGGGGNQGASAKTGGSGVGGNGAYNSNNASNPTANTGSGGGGGRGGVSPSNGAAGIVIIRYTTGSLIATGGTITTSGNETIHTFTSSGTFTVTAVSTPVELINTSLFNDSDLLAYYRFEDNANDSKNSYNGTATDATYTTTNAKFNKGISLNGSSSKINLGTDPLYLNSATSFSIAMWAYINPATFDNSIKMLLDSSGGNPAGNNGFYIAVDDRGGSASPLEGIQFALKAYTGGTAGAFERAESADNAFATAGLYHIVCTYSSSDGVGRVYVNGALSGTVTNDGSGNFVPRNANLYVGALNDSSLYATTVIDDLAIFKKALSANEVLDLYVGSLPSSTVGGAFLLNFI
jgi:hypothetical protein